eukprot:COSAG01_NODE_2323_length_7908_cov_43.508388_14_plen_76_part_00
MRPVIADVHSTHLSRMWRACARVCVASIYLYISAVWTHGREIDIDRRGVRCVRVLRRLQRPCWSAVQLRWVLPHV